MSAPSFSPYPPSPDSPPPSHPPPTLLALPSYNSSKKPQFLPWTHEETVNLIEAYQTKWYSLKRGPLKASQWEEVAVTVAARCCASPEDPSKTATQCRHKIEKLRKRYRAERQRPGGSAWPYFDLMDRMERGPLPISVAPPVRNFGREEEEDGDYGAWIGHGGGGEVKRRKSDSVSRVAGAGRRRFDEFGGMVDGFLRKLGGGSASGGGFGSKLKFCSNNSTRFHQQRRFVEQEDDDEELDVNGVGKNDGNLMELGVKMREFAERFVRIEKRKMEVMRETERYRLEMEEKRMDMILQAQKQTVDFISKAFASSPPLHNHHHRHHHPSDYSREKHD